MQVAFLGGNGNILYLDRMTVNICQKSSYSTFMICISVYVNYTSFFLTGKKHAVKDILLLKLNLWQMKTTS